MIKLFFGNSTNQNFIAIKNTFELLQMIDGNSLDDFMQEMACNESVIKHVSELIMYGCTRNKSYGPRTYETNPVTELDIAIRLISEHSSAIAADEIGMLKEKLEKLEVENKVLQIEKTILENEISQ